MICNRSGVPNPRWTDAQITELRTLHASGLSNREIGAALGRSGPAIERFCAKLRLLRPQSIRENLALAASVETNAKRAAKVMRRSCLMCPKTFVSSGPGHRICDRCRCKDVWRDGIFDFLSDGSRQVRRA